MDQFKYCTNKNCSEINPQVIKNFYNDKTTKDLKSFRCKSCYKIKNLKYKEKNPQYQSVYSKLNAKNKIIKVRSWQKINSQRVKSYNKEWQKNNPKKITIYQKKYVSNNLHKFSEKQAKRRAIKLQAVPKWLSKIQQNEIKNIYYEARKLTKLSNINYEVDHIIPLNSKDVCGLHVPWNLQIITETENCKKKNKFL